MDRKALLQGMTQPEERLLFAKVLDQAAFSYKRHTYAFTDFLDAAKSGRFLEKLRYETDMQILAFGGAEDAERSMIGFAPDYVSFSEKDFPISALRITKNQRFGQKDLTHRDYLGSILGLGIDRGKVGDILVSEQETICFVKEEIASYIQTNLERVSKTPVLVEEVPLDTVAVQKKLELHRLTTASLRLDAVAGGALHLSRGNIQRLIVGEKANVNWNIITNPSFLLKEGDVVSVRGYGRFRLLKIGGKTKKDRIGLEIGLYV